VIEGVDGREAVDSRGVIAASSAPFLSIYSTLWRWRKIGKMGFFL
jgi:hypothetical protein